MATALNESENNSFIYINRKKIPGRLSLTGRWNRSVQPESFDISGVIETTEYLDGTYEEVWAGRLSITDLRIESESFGSEDDNIVFEFTAGGYNVLEPRK